MSNVIQFPNQNIKKLHLFDDEEIFITVASINIFAAAEAGIANPNNLHEYDPDLIIECVRQFKNSGLLSNRARVVCKHIIDRYNFS